MLLDAGADINAKDQRGLYPVFIAVMKGHTNMAQLLIARGGIVDEDHKAVSSTISHR